MKHYGIRNKATKLWLIDANGMMFWTTGMGVAEAQLAHTRHMGIVLSDAQWEIAEFVPEAWRKQVEQWVAEKRCPECGAGPMPVEGVAPDSLLGGCSVPDCPIDPTTGFLAQRLVGSRT